jgi:hypothetical protein
MFPDELSSAIGLRRVAEANTFVPSVDAAASPGESSTTPFRARDPAHC